LVVLLIAVVLQCLVGVVVVLLAQNSVVHLAIAVRCFVDVNLLLML